MVVLVEGSGESAPEGGHSRAKGLGAGIWRLGFEAVGAGLGRLGLSP